MADGAEEVPEDFETGAEFTRQYLVVDSAGEADLHYNIGLLPLGLDHGCCSIICIAEVGGQLLCCLPHAVWSRKVTERLLEPKGFTKPILVSASAVENLARDTLSENSLKVWVGLLSKELEATVFFHAPYAADYPFSGIW